LNRILLIARRDYVATVTTKAFLIGLVVAPIMFGGGFLGIALLRSQQDFKERHVAIVDRTGEAASGLVAAAQEKNAREQFDKKSKKQTTPHYDFEIVAPQPDQDAQRLALSERVRHGELFAFIEIGPEALNPPQQGEAHVPCYTNAGTFDEAHGWLEGAINDGLMRARLTEIGVDRSHFNSVLANVNVQKFSLVSLDPKTGQIQQGKKRGDMDDFAVAFGLMLLLGMIVMASSSPMLSSVTEDKAQRIVEMLLGLATPFELMMGKVVAAVGVSLTSSAFYVIGGTLALQGLGMAGFIPFALLPWFYIYLLADVVMLSALAAAFGAGCGSPQEAQQLSILLLSPVLIPFFTATVVIESPHGPLATALSWIPPFTPMLMLVRQAVPGGVTSWQPFVSLLGVVVFVLITVWAAARIFRVAILMQGKSPKLAEMLRWAVRG
jgi:ABC-2 type transport system permease protein